jgi:glycosyltransferase involved in cell wall biosynthesis
VSPESLPSVSVLVASYNYAHYVGQALDSIIAQDYPFELFDVIVVNDGSKDNTAEVVQPYVDRYPEQIRLINQENSGLVASLNLAAELARGDLFAIFDADDVWLPHKTREQVKLMQADPSMTMVCSNMAFIDAENTRTGEQLHSLGLQMKLSEPGVGTFPQLLKSNYGMQSSLLFKREVFQVAPPAATYTDWWYMLCAAYEGTVGYIPDDLALYRMHSQNLTAAWRYDDSPEITVREHTRAMGAKLSAVRHFDLSRFSAADALTAWQGAEDEMWNTFQRTGTLYNELVRISDDDRVRSDEYLERANAAAEEGDHTAEAIFLWKALAWNPYGVGLKARLVAAGEAVTQADRYPHPLEGAKGFVVLADAEELLSEPALLTAYADAFAGSDDVTLAIDATDRSEEEAGEDLQRLIVAAGVDGRQDLDVLGVVGVLDAPQRYRMLRGAHARLRAVAGEPRGHTELPEFDAATLTDLRELAAEQRTLTPAL